MNDAGSLERGKHGAEPSEGLVHLINVEDAIAIVELPIVHDEFRACKSLAERTINVDGSAPIIFSSSTSKRFTSCVTKTFIETRRNEASTSAVVGYKNA